MTRHDKDFCYGNELDWLLGVIARSETWWNRRFFFFIIFVLFFSTLLLSSFNRVWLGRRRFFSIISKKKKCSPFLASPLSPPFGLMLSAVATRIFFFFFLKTLKIKKKKIWNDVERFGGASTGGVSYLFFFFLPSFGFSGRLTSILWSFHPSRRLFMFNYKIHFRSVSVTLSYVPFIGLSLQKFSRSVKLFIFFFW